jgi:GDP-L-fucose synthase
MLSHINVCCGHDITFQQLAQTVAYTVDIAFDPSQPDGIPRKLMDSTRLNTLGWFAKVKLEDELARA